MRKIRAHLLETVEKHWQDEVIGGASPTPSLPAEQAIRIS
jgi:hypothetical protein